MFDFWQAGVKGYPPATCDLSFVKYLRLVQDGSVFQNEIQEALVLTIKDAPLGDVIDVENFEEKAQEEGHQRYHVHPESVLLPGVQKWLTF